jgi:hypothetical protein
MMNANGCEAHSEMGLIGFTNLAIFCLLLLRLLPSFGLAVA